MILLLFKVSLVKNCKKQILRLRIKPSKVFSLSILVTKRQQQRLQMRQQLQAKQLLQTKLLTLPLGRVFLMKIEVQKTWSLSQIKC